LVWWGWLIIATVCSVATGVIVWIAMRRRASDAAADQAVEVIEERREERHDAERVETESIQRLADSWRESDPFGPDS
jgi:hypothetical protein